MSKKSPKEKKILYVLRQMDMPADSNDDRILVCCLQWKEKSVGDEVLLITRDINLSNKSYIMGVDAVNTESIWPRLKMSKPNFRSRLEGRPANAAGKKAKEIFHHLFPGLGNLPQQSSDSIQSKQSNRINDIVSSQAQNVAIHNHINQQNSHHSQPVQQMQQDKSPIFVDLADDSGVSSSVSTVIDLSNSINSSLIDLTDHDNSRLEPAPASQEPMEPEDNMLGISQVSIVCHTVMAFI